MIYFDGDDDETDDTKEHILLPPAVLTKTYNDVKMSENVSSDQRNALQKICKFADVLTDLPGVRNMVEHRIDLMTNEPVRIKQYPLPNYTENTIKEDVGKMLQLKVIEPFSSPYCAPIVIALKKDGTNRFCVDFRNFGS